ncbi:MAG: hypothetical protein P4L69_13465, partial [Desulfosporosinus sp.]|nr:hypothetical protein [Desulfosporosinus sp.]
NLGANQISAEGATAMSMVLRNENCRLTKLELGDNDISEELLKSTYRILEENKTILFRSQLAERAAKSEERKRLAEAQQKNVDLAESLRSSLEMCDASIRESNEKKTVIDKQQNIHKKSDMITELDKSLKKVEYDFKLASGKISEQIDKKAEEVSEFRRILNAKAEDVNKRIAEEEEEKKKPLSAWKGKCALRQRVAGKLLAGYTEHKAYARVKKTYEKLVSNSSGDPVLRTVMLIIDLLLTHAV